jgi:hypothetical protein
MSKYTVKLTKLTSIKNPNERWCFVQTECIMIDLPENWWIELRKIMGN